MTEHSEHDEIVNGRDPRLPKRANRRAGVIGLLAVGGVAAGGAALYVANSAGAVPSTSSTASGSTSASSSSTSPAPSTSSTCTGKGPWGAGPGFGHAGRGPIGAGAGGRITAISSTSLTVRDLFGTSHTYKITSSTVVRSRSATAVKVSTLTVGENVSVRTSGNSSTATEIDLRLAGIDGSVTGITSSAITVTDRDGFTRTIDTDAATKYTVNSSTGSRSKITSGTVVHAEGKVDANGTALDAASIDVLTSAKGTGSAGAANPCGPGHGRGPGGPGYRWAPGGPGAPKPTSSATPTKPAPSTTPTR